MSKINLALPCWAPPEFPEGGRLQLTPEQVNANYRKQVSEEKQYRERLSLQAGKRVVPPCCHSLHISLFFDGTGNNEKNDTNIARPPHPTNIARLYHTAYPTSAQQQGYFSYYMPGVGTPFPKINEFGYSGAGLKYAAGGEDRINWALLRLVDALMIAVTPARQGLNDGVALEQIAAMRARWPLDDGEDNRCRAITSLLQSLRARVSQAQPQPLALKLFIYGFSRGAAEARTFVSWLSALFIDADDGRAECSLLGLPVSIEFLGLLDTVASVGVAHLAPGFDGHMGWAAGTQQLPLSSRFPGLVKCCRHFVAAHEQRLSFPLDSVRRPDGSYLPRTQEVIYPGVHSDVGGGYPPGEQGKSPGSEGELLSQIVLHDLYAAAFEAGAPLAVRPELITPLIINKAPQRAMDPKTQSEFDFSPILINRFNAWRRVTFFEEDSQQADTPAAQRGYHPVQLSRTLESAVIRQMAWITAWRIGRYAHNSLLARPFYLNAPQKDAAGLKEEKAAYDKKVTAWRKALDQIRRDRPGWQDGVEQGPPDYDPTNAQYQLREAAREFEHDYRQWFRDVNGSPVERAIQIALDGVLRQPVYLLNGDDEAQEYAQIRREGDNRYGRLFRDRLGTGTSTEPEAQVLALFDDQIHDSRAWFMQSTLGGREPWGGYFRYRMIYCGDRANKQVQLIYVAGKVVGARQTSVPAEYTVERRGKPGAAEVHKVRDIASGQEEVLTPGAMLAASDEPGLLAARESTRVITEKNQQARAALARHLHESTIDFIG